MVRWPGTVVMLMKTEILAMCRPTQIPSLHRLQSGNQSTSAQIPEAKGIRVG